VEAISLLAWTFDCLLGLGLLLLAWQALTCPDLFKAIVLFVTFGLLMALAWVRLEAPDIALAEVAIGAGLTGALLLAALARIRSIENNGEFAEQRGDNDPVVRLFLWLPAILLLMVAMGLGYAILTLPSFATGLYAEVNAKLDNSGVINPVTAVLLNFRGYDTLLEMVVLLVALLGVWSLDGTSPHRETASGPVLDTLPRLLTPVFILVAAYLLWVGGHAPGGAFQAGSVLGAAGVLLMLAGWRLHANLPTLPLRIILVAGPATFLLMALITLLIEGHLLKYPPARAGTLILILETIATLSIGATLAALFLGERAQNRKETK
jgi:multisubunit Na+/H+ antiporter MnhB subunit